MITKLPLALATALLLTACSSSGGTANSTGDPLGAASTGVTDRAVFCRGAHMEQTAETDKQDLASIEVMDNATSGPLHDATHRLLDGFKGSNDPKYSADLARVRTAAIATCHVDINRHVTRSLPGRTAPAAAAGPTSSSASRNGSGSGAMESGGGLCSRIPKSAADAFFTAAESVRYPLQLHPDDRTLRACTGGPGFAAFGVNKGAGENPAITVAALPTVHYAHNCGLPDYGPNSVTSVRLSGITGIYINRSADTAATGTSGAFVCWPHAGGVAVLDLSAAGRQAGRHLPNLERPLVALARAIEEQLH